MNIDYDLLTFCICMAMIFIIAAYAVCQIIKDAVDEGIEHHNEKPTAEVIPFKRREG